MDETAALGFSSSPGAGPGMLTALAFVYGFLSEMTRRKTMRRAVTNIKVLR